MMTAPPSPAYSVLIVDDNPHMGAALRSKFAREKHATWLGLLTDATQLVDTVRSHRPDIVVLDLDMPGPDPFEALVAITDCCAAETRVVVFTGHVRRELIDKATDAGAWGYVSKNDGPDALLKAIALIRDGEFAFSESVKATLHG